MADSPATTAPTHGTAATCRNGMARSATHTGVGFSVDQRVGDGITLFGRYGKLTKGQLPFDQALRPAPRSTVRTGVAAATRSAWAAPGCAPVTSTGSPVSLPVALGRDSDDNCTGAFNYNASGAEKVAEIYYRYRISPQFDLTPDFQWIGRPGANPGRIRSRSSACAPTSPSKEPHAMSNRPRQRHRPDSIWFALLTAGALLLTAWHCRRTPPTTCRPSIC